jgi:hypothetical protein
MTPKEKAEELFDKFNNPDRTNYPYYSHNAQQCALIAVDEIIKSNPLEPNDTSDWLQPEDWFSEANKSAEKYWEEVKKEIEAL